MPFFVDGNNCTPVFRKTEKAFVLQVLNFAELSSRHGTIVFDGERKYPLQGSHRVKVRYSGYGDADSMILDLMMGYRGNPSELILYSNDRDLCNQAKALGARCSSSRDLYDLVLEVQKRNKSEKPQQEDDVEGLLAQMLSKIEK